MNSHDPNDNSDDVAILDVTTDEQPLIANHIGESNSILSTPNVDTILVPSLSRYRLTNILRSLLFIEFLTLAIIWFIGKN